MYPHDDSRGWVYAPWIETETEGYRQRKCRCVLRPRNTESRGNRRVENLHGVSLGIISFKRPVKSMKAKNEPKLFRDIFLFI